MKYELSELRNQLHLGEGVKLDLRDSGSAAFLYIHFENRAAEVSISGEGFFVEYWGNANDESDSAPVKSEDLQSVSEVTEKLAAWL